MSQVLHRRHHRIRQLRDCIMRERAATRYWKGEAGRLEIVATRWMRAALMPDRPTWIWMAIFVSGGIVGFALTAIVTDSTKERKREEMIYEVRTSTVEAKPVEFAGANLMLIAVDGAAHVVPADTFQLLYREKPAAAPEPQTVAHHWARKQKEAGAAKKSAPAAKHSPSRKPSALPQQKAVGTPVSPKLSTGEAVIQAIKEGPHTTAEAIDRVCVILGWDQADKKLRERVYQSIWLMVKNGNLVKRDDPKTQLPALYLARPTE